MKQLPSQRQRTGCIEHQLKRHIMLNNEKIRDIQTLKQRFEYMFRGPVISIDFFRGWFADFVDLCFELDAMLGDYKSEFRWIQIKEKFGGCRMYFSIQPENFVEDPDHGEVVLPDDFVKIRAEAHRLVGLASLRMKDKCCVCGEFAVVDHHGAWLSTLCNFHFPVARAARGDTRTLHELTAVPATPQDIEIWRASS